ncbi:hypothetical protein ABZX85_05795 [Streptomyces sp. NPDC004539]|uniref:hypothetical protein n=1 Tax=Streptomyces sp. NPDC004539 TaxID=3154280 RepID=UPI0033A17CC6
MRSLVLPALALTLVSAAAPPHTQVVGSLVNRTALAGGLTVDGDYVQAGGAELVARERPLTVSGRVRLAGGIDLSGVGRVPADEIVLVDHGGRTAVEGTFAGLPEGTGVELGSTLYRISYRGGDGNDVTLTATGPASALDEPADRNAPSAADNGEFGWWPYVLLLGTLGALLTPGTLWPRAHDEVRRGGRRRRGR